MGKKTKITQPEYIKSMHEKFDILLTNFKNIALNIFQWKGDLPDGLRSDYIEKKLFERGKLCYFDDLKLGELCLPCDNSNNLNVYERPQEYRITGFNYYNNVSANKCVIIKNNALATPTIHTVQFFCEHLVDIFSAFKINLNYSKTPFIISGNKEQMLTFQNIIEQITGNKPAIFVDKELTDIANVDLKSTNYGFIGIDLLDVYDRIEDKLLTFLGINNANTTKRERLVVDEVNSNNDLIENNLDTYLTARKNACEEINKMFGRNITVEINSNYVKQFADKQKVNEDNENNEDNESGVI